MSFIREDAPLPVGRQITPTPVIDAARLGLPNIAFTGKAGAGKTTAAELLVELGYQRQSFAAPLKDIAARLWGETARTDREKLQRLGVAVREIEQDTWSNLLVEGLRERELYPRVNYQGNAVSEPPTVVDDMRFENEWFALKANGFVIVRITASRAVRIDRLKANGKWQDEAQLEHVSETALDHLNPDYTIHNDGPHADLYDEVVAVLLKERRRR